MSENRSEDWTSRECTLSEAKTAIELAPTEQAVILVGSHGIGKSELVKQIGEDLSMEVVTFDCTHISDVGDILGFPSVKDGKTEYNPTYWYKPEEPIILFFDEAFRANDEVRGAIMSICLEQKIGDKSLCKGSRVIAAGNPPDNAYDGTVLDVAQLSRYAVFSLEPSTEEWLDHAQKIGVHPLLIDWIRENPADLKGIVRDPDSLEPVQCPRSWVLASNHLKKLEEAGRAGDIRTAFLIMSAYLKRDTALKLAERWHAMHLAESGEEDSSISEHYGLERALVRDLSYSQLTDLVKKYWREAKFIISDEAVERMSASFNEIIMCLRDEDLASMISDFLMSKISDEYETAQKLLQSESLDRIREIVVRAKA